MRQLLGNSSKPRAPPEEDPSLLLPTPLQGPSALPKAVAAARNSKPQTASSSSTKHPIPRCLPPRLEWGWHSSSLQRQGALPQPITLQGKGFPACLAGCGGAQDSPGMREGCTKLLLLLSHWAVQLWSPPRQGKAIL